jgi:hypothetical protein
MFTSRMPIPYPPPGCKTAYIQNSRALVVPEGASLPPICVQCRMPSDAVVKCTFHWPRPEPDLFPYRARSPWFTPLLEEIAFLFRGIFRLGTRITLEIPLCSGHHYEEMFWRWLGAVSLVISLALLPFTYTGLFAPRNSIQGLPWILTIVMLFGGSSLIFSGANGFELVELNTAFAAYQGFGAEYMKQMPHEVQIFPPKYGGAAFASIAELQRRESRSTPTFSTDLL